MLIDWFTVAAQAVNFLILVLLLKRFLYGPIITAMNERRQNLAREQEQARHARQEADERARELADQTEQTRARREQVLEQARTEAEAWREQALAATRTEADRERDRWRDELTREQRALQGTLRRRIGHEVVALSAKALHDLSGADLNARAVDAFLEKLDAQPAPEITGNLVVRTGFELSPDMQQRLETEGRKRFPRAGDLSVTLEPELGFGIALLAGDRKWEWNLSAYLDSVEDAVFQGLAETEADT